MIEKGAGGGGLGEFAVGDGGDDDAADDEEEINAEGSVLEEGEVVGGGVFGFDAVEVGEDDEESCESATDLDADDSAGWGLQCGLQEADLVAPLYQCVCLRSEIWPAWCLGYGLGEVARKTGLGWCELTGWLWCGCKLGRKDGCLSGPEWGWSADTCDQQRIFLDKVFAVRCGSG